MTTFIVLAAGILGMAAAVIIIRRCTARRQAPVPCNALPPAPLPISRAKH